MPSPLQNTESVWWYVTREFEQTLGRPVEDDEAITVTLVVSALTKLLADGAASEVALARPRLKRAASG